MWNLKYDLNELIYKTERDSQTQKTNLWLPKGNGGREEQIRSWDQQIQTTIYKIDKQNKLYLKLHEVDSLLSGNCKMGHKAESFYRIKNKEQGTENWKISAWLGLHSLLWGEKDLGWIGVQGLADWIYCVSVQVEHLQGNKSYLSFGLLTQHSGEEQERL